MPASLPTLAHAYLQVPFNIFDKVTAVSLAQFGWQQLAAEQGISAAQYSTFNCLKADQTVITKPKQLVQSTNDLLLIEQPDFERLQAFYDEHGLEPLPTPELISNRTLDKLQRALAVLARVAPTYACVRTLVHSVQILRQPDPEIDVSYSHPAIPFSIFVTVCEDNSTLSALRVAEAVLHETMHLYLTLLERIVDLVLPSSPALYYSPWREENRPVRGVLHGLFVFRAVHDFYAASLNAGHYSTLEREYMATRMETIKEEINTLRFFSDVTALTANGRQLVLNLL